MMKPTLITFIVFLISATCYSQKIKLEKQGLSSVGQVKVHTIVRKFQKKKERFYGTIRAENHSSDTLAFNFNQILLMNGSELKADYNFRPISYAPQAFYIYPGSTKTWDVIWKIGENKVTFEKLEIKEDLRFFPITKLEIRID